MLKMKHRLAALLVVLAAAFASLPASAMLPAAPETPEATASAAPEQVIDDTQEAGSDARIANRIRGIFGELPAFENVSVDVQQGVVSLAGTVPAQEDIARAET
ncbi:BON domain-containing protein, partial [Erythrobacter sp. HI0063]|uniref:BON domain-containing protein n=1 Tax=Erythrobacter sp. HI0063 TaxID=1822240 RepID=UPI000B27BECD